VPDSINGDARRNKIDKKKKEDTTGVGCGACTEIHEKEKEVEDKDPVLRQMVDALFLNHAVVAPSGKGRGTSLLTSGWDDFQVGQDL
jgi:hypothetical protein